MEELHAIGTIEAFAHSLRGVMALCFFYWSYRLYSFRQQWMARLLFWATLYVACCYVKDGLLMVEGWKTNPYLVNLITVIDLPFVPLTCAFFAEVCQPCFVKPWGVAVLFALQALFIPVYLLYPHKFVCIAAFVVAFVIAWMTLLFTIGQWYWYRRYEEYAYTKYFSIKWICLGCLLFFVSMLTYVGCFEEATWQGEVLFNALSLVLWAVPFRYAILMAEEMAKAQVVVPEEPVAEQSAEAVEPAAEAAQAETIQESGKQLITEETTNRVATLLLRSMKEERLFLNPKLTIMEVAKHIGINKTYISYYVNRCEGMSFYDYVNRFRVEEACALLDGMSSVGDRRPLVEVAELSGFNSFSTFNRTFVKLKGVTPGDYARRHTLEE